MPFTKSTTRTPKSIGQLVVHLYSDANGSKRATYDLRILDQDGAVISSDSDHGDLLPYLTQVQINSLIAFMDGLRTQAVSQIIG